MKHRRIPSALLRRMLDFKPLPGKWYVSYPDILGPAAPPVAGPFDTEEDAWQWVNKGSLAEGEKVWQHPEGSGRLRPAPQ
jgi:hypothetical protein